MTKFYVITHQSHKRNPPNLFISVPDSAADSAADDVYEPGEAALRNRQVNVRGAPIVAELLVRGGVRVEQLDQQLAGLAVLTPTDH